MTTHTRRAPLARLAIAGAFLLAGLAGAGQTAIAGPPLVDNGGSGGGTAVDVPTLVGSGPEREIVANSDGQHIAGALDEVARSIALIALSPQPPSTVAIAPALSRFGQPY